MADDTAFVTLIRRIREGDESASAELVRRYEQAIRVAVRVRLRDSGLRRLFDSMDICQSVLGNFFVRAASGQFDLERPEQLVGLLVTMARNRLTNRAMEEQAARRDHRRTERLDSGGRETVDSGPGPSSIVAGRELLQQVRARLSPEEQQLAEKRAGGMSWAEIAAEKDGNADALRMRLSRALDRVLRELKLDE